MYYYREAKVNANDMSKVYSTRSTDMKIVQHINDKT
jgi:hypothetical protein